MQVCSCVHPLACTLSFDQMSGLRRIEEVKVCKGEERKVGNLEERGEGGGVLMQSSGRVEAFGSGGRVLEPTFLPLCSFD